MSPADRLRRRFVKLLAAAFAVTKAADLHAAIDAEIAPTPPPPSGSPFLAFSDLQSGPKSGNTDTSRGAALGADGCFVTVWGNFLGASQGASKLTINGAECRIYYWGPAVPPWTPATLHAKQGMQLIIAQVMGTAVDGLGEIVATVNGLKSNALPFTVRPGRILYWKTDGIDTGDGTWQKPFKTLNDAIVNSKANKAGDIVCVCEGVNAPITLTLAVPGTPSMPMTLMTYPGARSQLGSDKMDPILFWAGVSPYVEQWKISKFTLRGRLEALGLTRGSDMIGCDFVSATLFESNTGCIYGGVKGSRIMGNEIHHCGTGKTVSSTSLLHCIYFSAARQSETPVPDEMTGYEIAWNNFHDLFVNRAINIYNQRVTGFSAHIGNGKIHHNAFVDCPGSAVGLLVATVGHNWIYSNYLVRCGGENAFAGDTYVLYCGMQFSSCYQLAGGTPDPTRKHDIVNHVWNNTLVDSGHKFPSTDPRTLNSAAFLSNWRWHDYDFHNNVVMQTNNVRYFTSAFTATNAELGSFSHNAWGGAGPVPAFERNGVSITQWEPLPGSPLIGSGLPTPFPMRDFTGRPIGRYMGAFQSVGEPTSVPVPKPKRGTPARRVPAPTAR